MFITTFGAKAYRRPLSTAETTTLTNLYNTGRTTLALDFNGAIVLLVEAMLQSPGFLYHWEMDPGPAIKDGAVVQLGNYQIANRLSYFLWGTMPDATLFTAAQSGQLITADGVQTQVTRMLADTKAQAFVADFIDDWLDVNVLASRPKDPTLYPMWNQDLATAMETEFRSFGTSAVLGSGLFADLLTGNKSSVNQALATVYGVSGITGTTPKAVTFDASQRAGILTLAGFLTVTGASDGSSPVRRGHAIYTRLLCGTVPDPPGNVPPPKPPTPGLTTRQRFEMHDMNACTGACHATMDPIGFGFEHYDGIGAFRTTDQSLPVDSNGSITLDGKMQTFADAPALAKLLAASPQAQACFAKQMTRYALNRWDTAGRRRVDPVGGDDVPGHAEHARPDRRGGHVADLPLPGARARGGAAMTTDPTTTRGILIKTSKTQAKYSRRAILKRLGIGAGFLPLLSTERARAAAPSGYPTRFIAITWTDGICPPNFYPDRRGGRAARDAAVDPHAAATWSSKLLLFRHATKQQSPIDINVMIDVGSKYGGHFTYPAMLTGGVSSPNGTDEVPTINATFPSIDQIYADNLLTQGVSNAQLNVGCRPYKSYTSFRTGGTPNTQQNDPYKLFTSLFGGTTMPPVDMNALIARRKSVLDFVGGELTAFAKNLGTDDKNKVMVHLESVRSLEDQLKPVDRHARHLHGAGHHADRAQLQHHRQLPEPREVHVGPGRGRRHLRQVARRDDGPDRQRRRQQPDVPVAEHPDARLPRHRAPGLGELRAEGGDRPVVLLGVRGRGGRQARRRHRGQRDGPRQHRHPRRQRHERGRRPLRRPDPVRDHRQRRRLLQDRPHGDVPEPGAEQPAADVDPARAGHDVRDRRRRSEVRRAPRHRADDLERSRRARLASFWIGRAADRHRLRRRAARRR